VSGPEEGMVRVVMEPEGVVTRFALRCTDAGSDQTALIPRHHTLLGRFWCPYTARQHLQVPLTGEGSRQARRETPGQESA